MVQMNLPAPSVYCYLPFPLAITRDGYMLEKGISALVMVISSEIDTVQEINIITTN